MEMRTHDPYEGNDPQPRAAKDTMKSMLKIEERDRTESMLSSGGATQCWTAGLKGGGMVLSSAESYHPSWKAR